MASVCLARVGRALGSRFVTNQIVAFKGLNGVAGIGCARTLSIGLRNAVSSDTLLRRGLSLASEESKLKQKIKDNPENHNAIVNYALFLHENGRLDEAEQAYEEALKKAPFSIGALYNYAIFKEFSRKKPEEAEPYYVQAIKCTPPGNNALATLYLAYGEFLLRHHGNVEKAEEYIRKTIDIEPENSRAYHSLIQLITKECEERLEKKHESAEGYTASLAERIDQAQSLSLKLLEQDSTNVEALKSYGNFLLNIKNDPSSAASFLQTAWQINPNDVATVISLANAFEKLNQIDEALSVYKLAQPLHENNSTYLISKGMFLAFKLNKVDEAEKCFEKILEIDPSPTSYLAYAAFWSSQSKNKTTNIESLLQSKGIDVSGNIFDIKKDK